MPKGNKKSNRTLEAIKEFWNLYKKQRIGLVGLGLLIFLLSLTILAPIISSPDTPKHWRDSVYWSENPRLAPPSWVGVIEGRSYSQAEDISLQIISDDHEGNVSMKGVYDYVYDVPPRGLKVKITISNPIGTSIVDLIVKVTRPDGESFVLYNGTNIVVSSDNLEMWLQNEKYVKKVLILKAYEWGDEEAKSYVDEPEFAPIPNYRLLYVLFSKKGEAMLDPSKAVPLKGKYIFEYILRIHDYKPGISVDAAKLIIQPAAYGVLGTDDLGEDLFVLLIWGVRPALLIGLLSSVISAFIGLVYGTFSAYYSGRMSGEIMKRINDIFYVMPVLPILIMISYSIQYTQGGYVGLWVLAILISVFSWPGMSVIVRSMALQIREEEFIEAAKAAGANDLIIIVKHIMPQLLPYVFANIALGVPGAILAEAGISFLGLGDPTSPTWGQMLYYAQRKGGVRYWWWVIPPGLMISAVSLSFAFIGIALDRILNPKLREF